MRFEFSADNVMALSRAIETYIENLFGEGVSDISIQTTYMDCRALIKKIKVYGQNAYENREIFRSEIKRLEEMLENGRKEMQNNN